MKFCATITGEDFIELFIHISGTISKLTSLCFRPDDSRVICDARVWYEVRQGDFFHHFHVEDVSEKLKEIYLELTSEHLFGIARSKGNASYLEAPVDQQVASPPHCVCGAAIAHRVLPPRAWEDFPEPGMKACDVSVYLLALKTQEQCRKDSTWAIKNLENMVQVLVESRKLLQFFKGQQINPVTVLCNVLSNTLLHLVLVREDVSLQYFIPASEKFKQPNNILLIQTSFEQLKMAVTNLKRQANKKNEGSLAYVKGGLSTFFEAQDALSGTCLTFTRWVILLGSVLAPNTGTPGLHSPMLDLDNDTRPLVLGHLSQTASLKRGSSFQSGRDDKCGVRQYGGWEVKSELSGQWLAHVIQTIRLTYESLTALEIPNDMLQTIQDLILDLREQRLLIVLSNCCYLERHTFLNIAEHFEKHNFQGIEKITQIKAFSRQKLIYSPPKLPKVSMASLKELDQRLFENYIELKADPIVGSLEPGIYAGYFDWKDCLPPTDPLFLLLDLLTVGRGEDINQGPPSPPA
ncbi:hypothetical protein GH733_016640, partial [Mirounga leonina]